MLVEAFTEPMGSTLLYPFRPRGFLLCLFIKKDPVAMYRIVSIPAPAHAELVNELQHRQDLADWSLGRVADAFAAGDYEECGHAAAAYEHTRTAIDSLRAQAGVARREEEFLRGIAPSSQLARVTVASVMFGRDMVYRRVRSVDLNEFRGS